MDEADKKRISERYRRFARYEARGQSPIYESLSEHIAGSDRLLTFLSGFPAERQQPNLFLAAIRFTSGLPSRAELLDELVESNRDAIGVILTNRTTQTNEPGRCAVLLPALASFKQPLALIEVGASAGLCLLPDFYGYDYGRILIEPPDAFRTAAPVLVCEANDATPLPAELPRIEWRAGLDLNPLSLTAVADTQWLETLIWPEHAARLDRLRAAMEIGRRHPPRVMRGDLREDLQRVVAQVPAGLTPVVFHTAVLAYVTSQAHRDAFARTVRDTGAIWISNEAPGVFPAHEAKVKGDIRRDRFLLAIDGEPVACTGPHGQSIDWFGM